MRFSKIVVGEEETIVVGLKPLVEMDVKEGGRNRFSSLAAEEGNLWSGESSDNGLRDALWSPADTGSRRFHVALEVRDHRAVDADSAP
jgi:hypothetical protein